MHFSSKMSHHALVFVAVEGTTQEAVTSFARQREVQKSSWATGCTVAKVDSIGNVNQNG